ncbi:MAG: AAA family ATPase [Chloroflexota bacterium]
MLKNIRIENFKSFQDTQTIELAPLTILAGINSAGKSSLIQALLLLKQSLETMPSVVLDFKGSSYLEQSLGDNFNSFIFGCPPVEEASLTYHLSFQYEEEEIADPTASDLFDEVDALLPYPMTDDGYHSLKADIVVTFAWGPFGHRGRPTVRMADMQIATFLNSPAKPLISIQIRPTSDGKYQIKPLKDRIDPRLKELNFQQAHLDGLNNFLPGSIHIEVEKGDRVEQNLPPAFARFFRVLLNLIRQDLTEHIYYLGSFRQPPEQIYASSQSIIDVVNPTGSNFAEILWRYRDEPVTFYHPRLPKSPLPLSDMVAWVLENILQLEQKVRVQPVGEREDILEVLVETLGKFPSNNGEQSERIQVPLSSVGLGYNQILPIVVQGLLTPPRDMVIYEQPEIHLHAGVQANLTAFFIGLIRSGRQVLVETHSSHMVDQLCLQIVRDREYKLEKNASVLFVHPPDKEHDSSRIEPVQIDPYGVIQNYPPNFLPDIVGIYEQIIAEGFKKHKGQPPKEI